MASLEGTPAAAPRSYWKTLYAMVWLAFAQILVALVAFPGSVALHVALGVAVVAVAHYHQARLKRASIPDRIRRIVRATANLASAQFFLGIYVFAGFELGWPLPVPEIVLILHLIVALAILSQASSTATAYDMWEEREFETAEAPAPKA